MKSKRKPNNPFVLTGYHSPEYFCDRKAELSWLTEQIENERNIVLHAGRRIGKTALIYHLFYQMEKDNNAETVFVDLLGTHGFVSANERIGRAILNKFGNFQKGIGPKIIQLISSLGATFTLDQMTGVPKVTFSPQAHFSPTASLEAIGDFLKQQRKKIVICLDEFQEIANYAEGDAEALFRSWTQQYPMIRFIFSGSHQHLIQTMFTHQSRPFYKSAQVKALELIEPVEYTAFINQHFSKGRKTKVSAELIDQLMKWTKGQTYYVQLVCNKLYGSKNLDEEQLHVIFDEIISQETPTFSNYQRLMTTYQWKVLSAIAKDGVVQTPNAMAFIQKHQLGTPSSVSTALKKLLQTELVVKDEGYKVQDVLLMRWLQTL